MLTFFAYPCNLYKKACSASVIYVNTSILGLLLWVCQLSSSSVLDEFAVKIISLKGITCDLEIIMLILTLYVFQKNI